jgi:hypothetical protein
MYGINHIELKNKGNLCILGAVKDSPSSVAFIYLAQILFRNWPLILNSST